MNLRLTSGFRHGMQLQSPDVGTRPTSGKVRAAVWNSLQTQLSGARVLDVFAGSGAVGIEALSRGARSAIFVESAGPALKALQSNLDEVHRRASKQGIAISTQVLTQGADQALKRCSDGAFDILWMDPPYALLPSQWPLLAPQLLRVAGEGALLLVESDAEGAALLASTPFAWELERQKSYGKIAVSFLRKKG